LSPYFHGSPKVPEVLPISNRAGYRPAIASSALDTLLGQRRRHLITQPPSNG
jgi:hypothetical protein